MRRIISAVGILFLFLLLIIALAQPVTAAVSPALQGGGGLFSISPAIVTSPGRVNSLVPLSDGRTLVGGSFITINGQAAPHSLAIIKSDGSLDAAFQVDPELRVNWVNTAAIQPDGKIVIAGWFQKPPLLSLFYLLRLNPNGTLDDTFKPAAVNGQVYSLLLDGDKILIGGNFTQPTPRIGRLNLDGTADPTFDQVGAGPDDTVRGIAQQRGGRTIIAGEFSSLDSVTQVGLARLNADGSLDSSFVPGGFRASQRVAVLNDDSVLVGGDDLCGDNPFAWYTAAGTLMPDLSPNPDLFQSITAFLPLPDGGFLVGGWHSFLCINNSPTQHEGQVWRYAADGGYRSLASFGDDSDVLALALRDGGQVMLGGQGRPDRPDQVGLFDGLALLDLSNDTLEKVPAFLPLVGDEAEIYSLSRYPDGGLLLAGDFSHVNGTPRFGLARLLPNGSLDPDFHPFAGEPKAWSHAGLALPDGRALAGIGHSNLYLIQESGTVTDLSALNDYDRVSTLALQSDGKVLVGTDFGLGVRRLKADFSAVDDTFVPGDAYGPVYALSLQAGGEILVAGNFSKYNNVDLPGLARLSEDGTIDLTFTPPPFMIDEFNAATLYSVASLSSGKLLVGGDFTTVGADPYPAIMRLNSDGTPDGSFTSLAGFHTVKTTCVQGDGSIWIAGMDSSFDRNPLVRHFNENGQSDGAFQSDYLGAHLEGTVNAVLCDNDGLSWTGGRFNLIDGRPSYSLAKYVPLRAQLFLPLINR